ncbi:hypothetical protein JCM10908_000864 [Rhodotorula pacifica]|uniref:uncharacterized protein n=1 Tax=Rhodotorula pacifica TaxID=1495444 RepID=UPI003175F74F
MGLRHRKGHKDQDDVESNDTAVDGAAEKAPQFTGDEYEQLLQYVEYEAQRSKRGGSQDDQDEEEGEEKRLWYAPWKKVRTQSTRVKAVPEDWLQTDIHQGLDASEIEKRRHEYGYNELESPTENQLLKFISYCPILYAMEIAVLLAAGLRDWIDFGVIIGILFMNAAVGWYQEKQAGDIVAQLKAGIAMKATVIRDGQEQEIEARDMVPGDIMVLEEGATIPADGRVLCDYSEKDKVDVYERLAKLHRAQQGQTGKGGDDDDDEDENEGSFRKVRGSSIIAVDQSSITGESLAVDKYINETAYYTCGVKRGKCLAVVTVSAKQSFVGKTAALVLGSNEVGHFKKVLDGIGTTLLVLVVIFVFAMVIGAFFRNIRLALPAQNNILVYTLIFLIVGVPVGLPVVTTTTMAVGAAYLAKRKAIVQKLTAIESLAGVDVLCSDKTGTLTANKLSLNEPYVAEGVDTDWFMAVAVLASSHNIKSLDPIDKLCVTALKDFPGACKILREGHYKTLSFEPFNPASKRITAEVEQDGKRFTCCKGAPNAILRLSQFPTDVVKHYRSTAAGFAARGFRSLGVAVKEEGKEWQLLGLLSMSDPPRADTPATIREAQELGIQIKMLTGDAVAIARETCRQLGMGDKVYDSHRLLGGGMSGTEIRDFIEAADGFGEVLPEDKYSVVDLLRQRGHLVAMTGDGTNDAPALKQADCGIAVEGATDAARSAADIIFLDEGLSTMILAIKTAREIFHRMKSYIIYRIALCLHLEIYLLLSMLILNETIRVDLVVFISLFSDVATIAIAYDNAQSAHRPVEWQLPKVWITSTILGILLAAGTWIMRGTLFLVKEDGTGGIIQTYGSLQETLYLQVALSESWLILITRCDLGKDAGKVRWPSFWLIAAVLGVDILATVFAALGWMSGPAAHHGGWDAILTLVRIWGYCALEMIIIAGVWWVLNKINWLNELGRHKAGKKNPLLENFLTEVQRLTIVHERSDDPDQPSVFKFAQGTAKGDEEAPATTQAKSAVTKEKKPKEEKAEQKDDKATEAKEANDKKVEPTQ